MGIVLFGKTQAKRGDRSNNPPSQPQEFESMYGVNAELFDTADELQLAQLELVGLRPNLSNGGGGGFGGGRAGGRGGGVGGVAGGW